MSDYEPTQIEKLILKRVFSRSDGMDVWSLTQAAGISISAATVALNTLLQNGLLKSEQEIFFISPFGRRWVLENQDQFVFSGAKSWRAVPEFVKGNTISAYEPYAPSLRRLDKGFKSDWQRK